MSRRLRVLRPFFLAGHRQEAGAVIDVPAALAAELVSAHKAAPAPADAPQESPASPPPRPRRGTQTQRSDSHAQS